MRRLLSLLAVLALVACQKPTRTVPATFDSPRDVEFVHWCVNALTVEIRSFCEDDVCGCTDGTDGSALEEEVAFAVIANAGGRMVHRVRVDTLEPAYQDLDSSVPGVTGVSVPEGPVDVAPLSHPTLVAVISENEPAFSVVDLANAELATLTYDDGSGPQTVPNDSIPLGEPATLLRSVHADSESVILMAEPISRQLRVLNAVSQCGESPTRAAAGCRASVALTEAPPLALPGAPTDIAVRTDGRVFVTVRNQGQIFVGAAFGDEMETECGGVPCIFDTMAVGRPCSDGADNDGDGLVDQDDPQCFNSSGEEDGQPLLDGTLTACTNGEDDDGDGVADADDPDCRDAGDRVEGEGYDGVDGFALQMGERRTVCDVEPAESAEEIVLLHLPSLSETVLPDGATVEIPRCSNGEDDDGDGATDWPEDTDCYGPNDNGEVAPARSVLVSVVLSEEEDLVYSVDRRTRQVFIHDAGTLELIRSNELDNNHSTLGTLLLTEFPGPLLADTTQAVFELATSITVDGATLTHARQTSRRVHVATASGFADTVLVDSTFEAFAGDPREADLDPLEGPITTWLSEPYDVDAAGAVVERVDCSLPGRFDQALAPSTQCNDLRLPTPRALANPCEGIADSPEWPPAGDYFELAGRYFASLTTRSEVGVASATDSCDQDATTALLDASVTDDYAITGGVWSVVYQGELNGSGRDDGLLMTGAETTACPDGDGTCRGWVEFAGEDPCQANSASDFCSLEGSLFEASDCPELSGLCGSMSTADVCAQDVDVCGICPSACRSAVDFCATGIVPNDLLIIERQNLASDSEACTPFGPLDSAQELTAPRLEYVICSIAEAQLEIATLADGCGGETIRTTYESITSLPPAECYGEPLTTSVRAHDWLVRIGSRVGPSPYRAVDGRCVLRSNAEERLMRLAPDHTFSSPLGVSFTMDGPLRGNAQCDPVDEEGDPVEGSVEVFPRDFELEYDIARHFGFRSDGSRQFLLGPATSAMAIGDTDRRGRRIFVVDESQSFLWVYNATNFREVARPLP